ncbi:ribonuclease H-like domain-containing protein [Gloeopeniophorella convolvens]|nr:ribonuclease H-like domain-containing protein [Gloeopeniophorella convolvens]
MFSVLNKPTTTSYVTPAFSVQAQSPDPASLTAKATPRALATVANQLWAVKVPQPYDAFLVLDVEATCFQGTDFQWPNEIIEWPVCLLRWSDKGSNGMAGTLHKVAEFRSFVKPTWRPVLSSFCTSLTGITQEQVDAAPHFPEVAGQFSLFLAQHGLIHPETGERLVRFCWCTDGPFDVRDFVVKQCFISNIAIPHWLRGDVMDVRKVVSTWSETGRAQTSKVRPCPSPPLPRRMSPNIEKQLRFLGLAPFEGRQHSGIDDSRNIARIIVELARRGIRLQPNTPIKPGRRWPWMGKSGQVLEVHCSSIPRY